MADDNNILNKLVSINPELVNSILEFVPGEKQLKLLKEQPHLEPLIKRSRNLAAIQNYSFEKDQDKEFNEKQTYLRKGNFRASKKTMLIGSLVQIDAISKYRSSKKINPKGVIINITNGCTQNEDWLKKTKAGGERITNLESRYYQQYALVLLDLESLCSWKKSDLNLNRYSSAPHYKYYSKTKFMKTINHQYEFINDHGHLEESSNYMIYIKLSLIYHAKPALENGIKNPMLKRYFKQFCPDAQKYIMNDVWASQRSNFTDHQKVSKMIKQKKFPVVEIQDQTYSDVNKALEHFLSHPECLKCERSKKATFDRCFYSDFINGFFHNEQQLNSVFEYRIEDSGPRLTDHYRNVLLCTDFDKFQDFKVENKTDVLESTVKILLGHFNSFLTRVEQYNSSWYEDEELFTGLPTEQASFYEKILRIIKCLSAIEPDSDINKLMSKQEFHMHLRMKARTIRFKLDENDIYGRDYDGWKTNNDYWHRRNNYRKSDMVKTKSRLGLNEGCTKDLYKFFCQNESASATENTNKPLIDLRRIFDFERYKQLPLYKDIEAILATVEPKNDKITEILTVDSYSAIQNDCSEPS